MDAAPVLAPELACQLVRWRREFHRRPEVGWTEFWTTARLAELLGAMGLSPRLGAEMLDKDSRMGLPPEAALQSGYFLQYNRFRKKMAPERVCCHNLFKIISKTVYFGTIL